MSSQEFETGQILTSHTTAHLYEVPRKSPVRGSRRPRPRSRETDVPKGASSNGYPKNGNFQTVGAMRIDSIFLQPLPPTHPPPARNGENCRFLLLFTKEKWGSTPTFRRMRWQPPPHPSQNDIVRTKMRPTITNPCPSLTSGRTCAQGGAHRHSWPVKLLFPWKRKHGFPISPVTSSSISCAPVTCCDSDPLPVHARLDLAHPAAGNGPMTTHR